MTGGRHLGSKKASLTPMGYSVVVVCYSNIYHECLAKLLRECSDFQGECKGCPVKTLCSQWWDSISECAPNCSKITAENFPYLVLQFLQFREKSRRKSEEIVKDNGHIYQKEVVHAKH